MYIYYVIYVYLHTINMSNVEVFSGGHHIQSLDRLRPQRNKRNALPS